MPIDEGWPRVARRAVAGLGVQPGELVQVRDQAGRPEVLVELLLAVERAGATPWLEIEPPAYVRRLLAEGDPARLAGWDRHRGELIQRIDRVLVLGGDDLDVADAPPEAVAAWRAARHRVSEAEEARRLPFLLLAVPTAARARQIGMALADLEAAVLPAMAVEATTLRGEIDRMLGQVVAGRTLTVHSGAGCTLHLTLAARPWMSDDGAIDSEDRARGAIVSNIPAGSIYTTVLESATHGQLCLPQAGEACDVVLRFAGGRIADIAAASGADALRAMFDRHSGEPRRVSHIGIGLNPYLRQPLNWVLLDEHIHGALFIAFGENRYMGGANESSLNVDYTLPGATLLVDDQVVIADGKVTE
jgi:leucyl aminopeptidase (aminopeptidase T)